MNVNCACIPGQSGISDCPAWLKLTMEMLSLFARRSHRDFALNHWLDAKLLKDLSGRYREKDHAPLSAGEPVVAIASSQRGVRSHGG